MKYHKWHTIVVLIAMVVFLCARAWAVGTHSSTEPTWEYHGVVTSDAVKMKHLTVVHDPLGISGVSGSPHFMMWWGTSTANQLYAQVSDDGINWTSLGQLTVSFPSTVVPVYHPEVIYDRDGFDLKKSPGTVYFKMWFYDAGQEGYNWMRYAESGDGVSWQVYEDSPDAASGGKNYLEFSGGSGNEMSVLYRRGGTGIIVNSTDQEYVGYQAQGNPVGISTDGAWFTRVDGQGGGPTDVCREMIIAGDDDVVGYRAWDDFPGGGDLTSWDSDSGLSWTSPESGNAPINGIVWTNFYGAMSVVDVVGQYYMYDTIDSDNYSVGLLIGTYAPATEVWVDDDYCSTCDNDGHTWGYDAFDNIQAGIDNVSGSTVHVAAGNYPQRLTINKSLDLRGAQYGVDPTQPGARINPVNESVIDISGLAVQNPNVAVEISNGVTDVTLGGFTLIGSPTSHYADESIVRCWDDNLAIEDNIMDGYIGVLYKGATNLTVQRNRITANKNGIIVQPSPADSVTISDNHIVLGSTPGGGESGIYWTSCSHSSATGNTATGFINGKGLTGSNLDHITVSGNTFDGNKDNISFWGNTTFITISGNVLTNALRYGISLKGQDLTITGNTITGSADAGVNIDRNVIDTERVSVTGNHITGNTNYGLQVNTTVVTETVAAAGNWWGDASGPYHATTNTGGAGDAVTDGVDYSPWWGADYLGDPHTDPWVWHLNSSNSSTIQEGIDGASSGDTVNVRAGTYNENPNVNKENLVLLGEDKTATFIMTTSSSGMAINASGVHMAGFTVKQNNAAVVQKDLYIGLSAWVSGITVRDCIFDGTGSTKSGSMGIQVRQADDVTIEDVESFGWTGYGVNVYNAGPPFIDDVLITGSTFHDNGYFGVSIDRSTNVRVRDCTISGAGGSGLAVFEDSGKPATGAEITGCTIRGPFSNNGILVVADSVLIQNNEIYAVSDTDTRGIRITTAYWPYYSADGNMVMNNFIHDNDIGLEVDFGTHDEPTGNVIFENSITGNTVAVEASECTQPLDASGNWWGSAEPITVGALMSGMADYTPWLHEGTDISTDPGFQGDFSHLHVDDNSAQAGAGGRITEGIEKVVGSTVEVEPGIYDEIIEFADSLSNLTVIGNADAFGLSSTDTTLSVVTGGVIFSNTTGEISGVTIENLYIQGQQTSYRVIGNAYQHKAVKGFTLRNCVVDGEDEPGRDGIMVDSGGGREGFGGNLTIDHVEFKDILHYGVMELFDGTVVTPFDTVTFVNSWVHECDGTVALRGHATTPTASIVVSGNTWENIGDNQLPTLGQHWAALEINRAQNVQIDENTIDNVAVGEWGEGEALQMWDVGVLDVHDNHFINCYQGIFIWGNSGAYAVPAGAITHNDISGNDQYGIMLDPTATGGPLNATANWWGHASGPQHASNPGGTGDVVSDNVDYSPWWGDNYVGQPHPWVWFVSDTYLSTIGEAVGQAGEGDTIFVSPGLYEEQVVITTDDLALLGSGCGSDPGSASIIKSPVNLTYSFSTGSNDNYPIVGIDGATGVRIQDFSIDGAGRGNSNYRFVGIGFWNGDGEVDRCCLTGVRDEPFSGAQHGVGIYAYNDGTKGTYDIAVTNTTVDDFQKTAMALSGAGLIVTVDSCAVTGAGPTSVTAQNGVQIGYDATGAVTDCQISGIDYTGTGWSASGIMFYYPSAGAVLTGNDVHDCQGALNAYFADGLTMSGNDWTDNEFVYVWGGDGGSISGDGFSGNEMALYIADATNLSLDEAVFDGNDYAIIVDGLAADVTGDGNQIINSTGCGIVVQPYGTDEPSGVIFHSGNISGNAYGVSNSTSNLVDAEENWWGDASGPTTAKDGLVTERVRPAEPSLMEGRRRHLDRAELQRRTRSAVMTDRNAKGSGDAVSALVDYSPWWGADYLGDPHSSPWQWYVDTSNNSGIQEGIEAASPGDTVNVTPDTYPENVNVDKTLTVRSTGGASVTTVDAGDTDHGFNLTAADIVLDGFTVINASEASQHLAGIRVTGVRGAEIKNNVVHDCQHGIYFYQTGTGAVNRAHDNTVYDSRVVRTDATDGIGIIGWGDGTGNSYLEITDNEIYTCDRQGIFVGGWPNTCRSANVTISGNEIHDNGQLVAALVTGYGMQIDFVDHSVIEENEIYNHGDWTTAPVSGYYLSAITGSACDSNLIRNNHCYHNKYGIILGDRGPFEDPNNTAMGNQIVNNFVEQNYRGVYITYDTATVYTTVRHNDLSGCTDLAVRKYPPTSGEVADASANWFGTIDAAAIAGLVTADYVDYSPWLHRGVDLSIDPGFQPDLSYLHVDDDSPISGEIAHIQEGVNMVDDDTVQVEPGLYEEQVVITMDDLALLGAGCGSDPDSASIIKSPVNMSYSFNTGSSDNYPIVGIDGATGVSIEDFSIDGAGRGNTNERFVGIGFWNGDGSVERCCLTGVRNEPFSGAQHGVAVYAYNDGTKGTYDIDVTETSVDDFQKTAMALSGDNLTVDVAGCTITGAGATGVTAQNGIQIGFGAGGTVTDCSVEGIGYTGSGWTASGMLFYEGTTVDVGGTCTVTDCQASIIYQETDGSATGVVVNSAGIESEEGISIRDYAYEKGFSGDLSFRPAAPLEDEPSAGRQAKGAPTTVVLSDLHLTGNHGVSTYGVAAWSLGDDVDVTLTDSEIRDWEIGLVAYEDVSAVELTANHNDISSNDMGYYSNAAAMQNAMSNHWGDFYGPLQATTNPTAGGDEVSDLVDYSPWWTSNYAGDPHTDPWSWGVNTSNGSGLQEGIDSASVADTVNAMADLYEENIVVDKTLVLRGAQAGVDARSRTADEALITASSGHLVDIQADDVVMDGFQVTGAILAEKLIRLVSAGSGLQLLNNIIDGTAENLLWLGTTATGVLIHQNRLDATSTTGTYGLADLDASSVFSGLTVTDNHCDGGEFFAGNKTYNLSLIHI